MGCMLNPPKKKRDGDKDGHGDGTVSNWTCDRDEFSVYLKTFFNERFPKEEEFYSKESLDSMHMLTC